MKDGPTLSDQDQRPDYCRFHEMRARIPGCAALLTNLPHLQKPAQSLPDCDIAEVAASPARPLASRL